MATQTTLTRTFIYGDQRFPDPGPEFSNEQVLQHLRAYFPELANARIEVGKPDNDTQPITFVKQGGRKAGPRQIMTIQGILHRLAATTQADPTAQTLVQELVQLDQSGQLTPESLVELQPRIEAALDTVDAHVKAARRITKQCLHLQPTASRWTPTGF